MTKVHAHHILYWQQNYLSHFALKGLSDVLLTSKAENKAFPPPSPLCDVVRMFKLPIENNKHPNFEWRGEGRAVDSFVLWSYPIWVQCLNNFVAGCRLWAGGCLFSPYLQVDPQHSKFWSGIVKSPCECWSLWFWMYGLPPVFLTGSFC